MKTSAAAGHAPAQERPAAAGREPSSGAAATRMHEAIAKTIAVAPAFLRGEVDADHMAHTMVHAVRDYVEQARANHQEQAAKDPKSQALEGVLAELMGCGSGYLAGRCDAACVARTMTYMVKEFGPH